MAFLDFILAGNYGGAELAQLAGVAMSTMERGPSPRPPTPPPNAQWNKKTAPVPTPLPGAPDFGAHLKVDLLKDAKEYILQGVRERKERRQARLAGGHHPVQEQGGLWAQTRDKGGDV